MFTESAEHYDLIYSRFKNYPREAASVARILRRAMPTCRTLLDVACGTGEHARLLAADGFGVDGLDLDPTFVRIAAAKLPAGRVVKADMSNFQLGRQYDAVTCLFSSIGYLQTLDRVTAAFACFRDHLAPNGVIIVEPWFRPGRLRHGHRSTTSAKAKGLHVTRVSRIEIDGRMSRVHFDYTITGTGRGGVRHVSEVHELGLFTRDELLGAFRAVGLEADYRWRGLTFRGLYLAAAC
jgi:SAM-dependent methyltransferase